MSRNAHITFIFGQGMLITVYAYRTSEFFWQKKPLDYHFNTRNYFRDELLHLLSISESIQTTCYKINDFEPHYFSNF